MTVAAKVVDGLIVNSGAKTSIEDAKRRLIWHGMFLFLLGLLTGFVEQNFGNPRMGLAAHLEGVMNGTFLVALGAAWTEVRLSPRLKGVAYWSALYGTYANWAVTLLAAIFGTAAMSPITAAGRSGQPWQEGLVTLGFISVGDSSSCLFDPRPLGSAANHDVVIVDLCGAAELPAVRRFTSRQPLPISAPAATRRCPLF
jgi:hydroxylaminobenzene mutase